MSLNGMTISMILAYQRTTVNSVYAGGLYQIGEDIELEYGNLSIDVDGDTVIIAIDSPNSFDSGVFNGPVIEDVLGVLPTIGGITLLENNMAYDLADTSFDDDTLSLNLESLAIPLGTGLKFRIELTPSDIALSSYSVNENAAGAVIGDISVDDLNDADTHTLAVDDDRFEIVGGQLKLKADSSLDFNDAASIDVKITAEDSFGLTYEEIMTINVTDLVDRISGGKGNDTLLGTAGADIIRGKQGNDKLWGYGGDDVLRSKVGNDKFWGGAGADTFIYSTHSGRDTIMDFETGIDKIDLSKWKAIENYADVKSHARNHGDDLWITAGKDTLIIKDFSKGELDVNDFLF